MADVKLTKTQYLVMRNIRDHGWHAATGFHGASARGGAVKSVDALRKRGLVEGPHRGENLTEEGVRVLQELENVDEAEVEAHVRQYWGKRFDTWSETHREYRLGVHRRSLIQKRLKP